ncbi:ABC transporter substrate-binding protein [Paenirhodobacter populi]|nr:ABC transporter substrate-binding protein [Sinirhodobacter populi]
MSFLPDAKTAFAFARATLVAAALTGGTAALADGPVRIGAVGGLSHSSIGLFGALADGSLDKAGVAHELTEFKGGGPAVQALAGGAIDVCVCAPEHVVRLRNRGIDAIVLTPLSDHYTYAIFGPKGTIETGLDSLKGKKVGITSPGSKTDTLIRLDLKRAGIEPDVEVELVGLGGTAGQLTALQTGNIAAGFINGIDALTAEEEGYPVVHDWRDIKVPDLALIVTEDWIKANPDTARKLATITLEGSRKAAGDRDHRLATLKQIYPHASETVIVAATDRLNRDTVTTPTFDEATFQTLLTDLIDVDPALKPITLDQFSRDFTQ